MAKRKVTVTVVSDAAGEWAVGPNLDAALDAYRESIGDPDEVTLTVQTYRLGSPTGGVWCRVPGLPGERMQGVDLTVLDAAPAVPTVPGSHPALPPAGWRDTGE